MSLTRAALTTPSLRRDLLGVFVAVLVLCALGARQTYEAYRLSLHSQSMQATVSAKVGGHGFVEYQYAVAGKTYTGSTPATSTGKGFDEVSIGDTVPIVFDPTNPGISGTAESLAIPKDTFPFVAAVLVLGIGFAFLRHFEREL